MSRLNIIRAWKDEEYRLSLSEAERALLPDHPAGLIEVAEEELDQVSGGQCGCSCACCCCSCPQPAPPSGTLQA
ncbi:MAG: mersacidin/lichenicidin family type 2 lantibiotic [Planctomycetaceae bacterium]|nr:mersacidin/lichenicidin family type 2 lantibiotic [Planctomycetaceae bacterium]MBV8267036.1 mersacidin/lichenicidin family type 2 lantibiotic [Planctomycetaceae bacterium]MBV8317014.1 mersacidin/lichenicidin family type 2 lantibiotic [Planctomycetaceae bacterium]MBV8608638.1 mersacidin/lichenicidin family type 2 lantibiotic [Singulisphaera sp.]